MKFKAYSFQDIIEVMASCDRLGLFYVVQKDYENRKKWFGQKEEQKLVWRLTVIEYGEDEENENLQGGQSEGSSDGEVSGGTETN